MQHVSPRTRALARLTLPSQGKEWRAWQGKVWEGMAVIYHLWHIMDPIYPQKGASCPRETFLCTYEFITA